MTTTAPHATPVHACLHRLLDLPGVSAIFLIDESGDCLTHLGATTLSPAKRTVWSVLARASFNAGDELGRRAEAGPCQEITNLNEHGGSILRAVPGGRLLVVQFTSHAALGTLRLATRQTAAELGVGLDAIGTSTPAAPLDQLKDSLAASLTAPAFASDVFADEVPPVIAGEPTL